MRSQHVQRQNAVALPTRLKHRQAGRVKPLITQPLRLQCIERELHELAVIRLQAFEQIVHAEIFIGLREQLRHHLAMHPAPQYPCGISRALDHGLFSIRWCRTGLGVRIGTALFWFIDDEKPQRAGAENGKGIR